MLDPLFHSVIKFVIAAILAASLGHKLLDFERFKNVIKGYGFVPEPARLVTALAILFLEASVLGVLVLGVIPIAAFASAALFILYGGLIAATLFSGREIADCGCSWVKAAPVSTKYLYRNAGLALLCLCLALPVSPRELTLFDYVNGAFSVVLMTSIYFLLDALLHLKTLEVSR